MSAKIRDNTRSWQPAGGNAAGAAEMALGCWTSACQARPIKWTWPDSQAKTHWALVAFSSSVDILRHRTCKSTRKSTCRMLGCPRQSPSSLGRRVAPAAACQPVLPSLSLMDYSPFAQSREQMLVRAGCCDECPVRQSDTRSSASQSVSFVIFKFQFHFQVTSGFCKMQTWNADLDADTDLVLPCHACLCMSPIPVDGTA